MNLWPSGGRESRCGTYRSYEEAFEYLRRDFRALALLETHCKIAKWFVWQRRG